MTFEPTPPPGGAPLPPGAGPVPAAEPGGAPVYRQDEFVRRPTSWTRPMQVAVAASLIISTIVNLASDFIFADDVRRTAALQVTKQFQASGQPVTDASIKSAVDLGMTIAIVFGVIIGLVFVGLAILTLGKPRTWVFWVNVVFLALGLFGLLSAVTSFTDSANASIPANLRPVSLVLGLVDAGLLAWLVVGLSRSGPWAQEKVPAAL
jgi:hypothetical protein